MVRRLSLVVIVAFAGLLAACATAPKQPVVYQPDFNGVYRLAYSASGSALYYRFFPNGTVLSSRSDAPAADVIAGLTLDNENANRGRWTAANGEIHVGVSEGTVSYDSRFDIRNDGRIALHGLPRAFQFLRTGESLAEVSSR